MRKILFRAKRLDNGEWAESKSIASNELADGGFLSYIGAGQPADQWTDKNGNMVSIEAAGECLFYACDPATIGQYTGLTDKNAKRIFEGDICRNTRTNEIVSVKWHGTMAGYVWSKRQENNTCLYDFGELFRACDKYEVIGNLHDNPELLEG